LRRLQLLLHLLRLLHQLLHVRLAAWSHLNSSTIGSVWHALPGGSARHSPA
jgi:hypothetical protein